MIDPIQVPQSVSIMIDPKKTVVVMKAETGYISSMEIIRAAIEAREALKERQRTDPDFPKTITGEDVSI